MSARMHSSHDGALDATPADAMPKTVQSRTLVPLNQVLEGLLADYADRLPPGVITRTARCCRRELDCEPAPALPELVDRLARHRLTGLLSGYGAATAAEHEPPAPCSEPGTDLAAFRQLRAATAGSAQWRALRERLAREHLPLVRALARRFAAGQEPLADLVQVGALALVKAMDRFDPDRGVAFSTYAVPVVIGEIKRYLRDSCWLIHVPRRTRELQSGLLAAITQFRQQRHRSPTIIELAALTGLNEDVVLETLDAGRGFAGLSLDAHATDDDGETLANVEPALLAETDEQLDRVEQRAILRRAVQTLPELDREIMALRFFADKTQTEIAELVGVSQMQVSRRVMRSLTTLRAWFAHQEQPGDRAARTDQAS